MSTDSFKKGFDCSRLKEVLPDYLDKTLQEHICAELRRHLDECEDCRIFVKTVETTIVLYKHSACHEVPEVIRIDLRRQLKLKIEGKEAGEDDG